jgi:hypothetical protein
VSRCYYGIQHRPVLANARRRAAGGGRGATQAGQASSYTERSEGGAAEPPSSVQAPAEEADVPLIPNPAQRLSV